MFRKKRLRLFTPDDCSSIRIRVQGNIGDNSNLFQKKPHICNFSMLYWLLQTLLPQKLH